MEYSPPPLFKQGASARLKVIVFAIIALTLLAVDSRVRSLATIRHAVGVALYPLQMAALAPRDAAYAVGNYFYTLSSVQSENDRLRRTHLANAQHLQQRALLASENAYLRQLLGAAQRVPVKSLMADILYDTRDPFTRKIVLDRGLQHDIKAGQPVIDDVGVIGQVTRVFPLTSEVTLLTDKAQAIPVQVLRSGVRSIAYGRGQSNLMDLRYMPANADIIKGDVLVTSGIDGVYPAGLAVARVTEVQTQHSDSFARIVCVPVAGVDRNRQLLVLLAQPRQIEPPEAEPAFVKGKGKPVRKSAKDGPQDAPPAASPGSAASTGTPAPKAAAAASPPTAVKNPAAAKAVAAPARSEPAKPAAPKAAPTAATSEAKGRDAR